MKTQVRLKRLLVCLGVGVLLSVPSITGDAQEVRSVETDGSIHFTGSYPLDPPNPTPPTGPRPRPDLNAKPPSSGRPGRLPQTNDAAQVGLVLVGAGLLFVAFWLKRRKDQQKEPPNNE